MPRVIVRVSLMTRCCGGCAVLWSALSLSVPGVTTAFQRYHDAWGSTSHPHILSTLPGRLDPRYCAVDSLRNSPWDDDNESQSTSAASSASSAFATSPPLVSGSDAVLSQPPTPTDATHLQMLSFYHFEPIVDIVQARNDCFDALKHIPGVRGTVYIAKEGINAQLAVPPGKPLEELLEACSSTKFPVHPFENQNHPNLGDVVEINTPTFHRLIVRTRDYILRDGLDVVDYNNNHNDNQEPSSLDWTDAGNELGPEEWHQTLQQQQQQQDNNHSPILVLDCRNAYESQQGTFQGAIPLDTETFQDSWEALRKVTQDVTANTPIAIFCTGGIRCVKTGAFLKQTLGFETVVRLQHGIIGYQRYIREAQVPDEESQWQGNNFLFDKRRISTTKGQDDNDTINLDEI